MKIRFKEISATDEFGHPYKDMEYLVLGMEINQYCFLNENNIVVMLAKDLFTITDKSQPEFWVEDNGRLVPEEWLWKHFFSLDGEPYCEWDEIWFITQFAKGLEKFKLSSFPQHFSKAYDPLYKCDLIGNFLKIASDYDSLLNHVQWEYRFMSFNRFYNLPYFGTSNGKPQYYEKIELTDANTSGFEILTDILKQIGSPFQYSELNIAIDSILFIRNRILFSIWSIWGTRNFDIFQLKYDSGLRSDYILKKDDDTYLLSFDCIT